MVEFATIAGARANGLDAQTGSLTPGKQADIILLRTDSAAMLPVNNPYGSIVYSAHPGVVDTVLVAAWPSSATGDSSPTSSASGAWPTRAGDYLFERGAADPAIPGRGGRGMDPGADGGQGGNLMTRAAVMQTLATGQRQARA